QQRNLAERAATLLAGLRIARFEVRGVKTNSTDGPLELATMRLNGLENGRLSDFVLEDLYAPRLKDPLRVGRLAFTAIDVASLMRRSAQLAALPGSPTADDLVGLMSTIEGVEVSSFSVPDRTTGQLIQFESFSSSWGRF